MSSAEEAVERLDTILEDFRKSGGTDQEMPFGVPDVKRAELSSRLHAAITELAPSDAQYQPQAQDVWDRARQKTDLQLLAALVGIARALRADLAGGHIK